MSKQIVTSSSAPTSGATPGHAISPLAQAIRFGDMLFVSGLGSVDPTTGEVVGSGIVLQTHQAFDNLTKILSAAGATFENIVNMRVTLRDMDDYPDFIEVFRGYLKAEKVTGACIGGAPNRPGIMVQIDCIAMFD